MLFSGINNDIKSKDEILSIISSEQFKNIFLNKNIQNVIIFGSLSNDNFNEESDIDIAVIPDSELTFNDEIDIESQLEDLLGREIDIININSDNVNVLIKFEALNSKLIVMKNDTLNTTIDYYENYYKENEEFWYFLDKAVLYNE